MVPVIYPLCKKITIFLAKTVTKIESYTSPNHCMEAMSTTTDVLFEGYSLTLMKLDIVP